MTPTPPTNALPFSDAKPWPVWEVGIYGFGDIFVEAPTKASARWWAASKCHEAGYGQSPIELIQRGVTVREIDRWLASTMGDINRLKRSGKGLRFTAPGDG